MALARPRGKLAHIRSKLHKCVARSRPLLCARARPFFCTIAVACPRPSTWCSRTNYWKGRAPAPLLTRARASPLKHVFGPPKGPRARALAMSRSRDSVRIKNPNAPLSPSLSLSLSNSLLFSKYLSFKTLILTHRHSHIIFVRDSRLLRIAKGNQVATDAATPSRVRASRNLNRERGDNFPNDRFDHHIHYDRWRGLENRGIVHEWIVRIDREEEPIFPNQDHVFLWGKRILFTEAHICRYLGIPGDAPDAEIDDAFVALAKSYDRGEDVNMAAIYEEIDRPETNWADNPTVHIIPKTVNNSVLNARATAWHKIIMANIDPKNHGTKFDLKHAFLIYVLMTEGDVNLPRIMRDILVVRPTKHPNHLLPFPVFIMRVANRLDTYVPYGDGRGEKARGPVRQRRQPPPQDQPAEQLTQPETSAAPSASAQPATDLSYQQIMRHLERQERLLHRQGRQIANTQFMIRQAFPDTVFEWLVSDDSSESQEF
ncbi:hypothetical protein PIB30_034227 [Stylosanthes scabra]|uniref:Putative plant transposon protein domain-containing protein n=1 Tax=Stylosanthes scabra TaxID=79078 RepID=A0ABU6UBH1_9FABA|nr:hypothetical protein [Stylosanthes scabra]